MCAGGNPQGSITLLHIMHCYCLELPGECQLGSCCSSTMQQWQPNPQGAAATLWLLNRTASNPADACMQLMGT